MAHKMTKVQNCWSKIGFDDSKGPKRGKGYKMSQKMGYNSTKLPKNG